MDVGVIVGVGVNVGVAVAGMVGVWGAVVGEGNSTCVGTGVEALHAVRRVIPIKVIKDVVFLFMAEL